VRVTIDIGWRKFVICHRVVIVSLRIAISTNAARVITFIHRCIRSARARAARRRRDENHVRRCTSSKTLIGQGGIQRASASTSSQSVSRKSPRNSAARGKIYDCSKRSVTSVISFLRAEADGDFSRGSFFSRHAGDFV